MRSAEIRPGEDAVIVGLGGVGMSALQGAVHAGARRIFLGSTPSSGNVTGQWTSGPPTSTTHLKTALAAIADLTGGAMAQKVIVTVGEVNGADLEKWMLLTAKAGTCVVTAVGSMLDAQVTLNLAMVTLLQKRLQGSIFGGANPYHDIPSLLSLTGRAS